MVLVIILYPFFKGTTSGANRLNPGKVTAHEHTNELLHNKLPIQMYALGAQSGTTYHSWAGLAANMIKFHGAQQDCSVRFVCTAV